MAIDRLLRLGVVAANALLPLALYFFCSGFFSYKPVLPGVASFHERRIPPPIFDKVIIMIVDALRR
jgi:ethanolamine phosphate transferase 2 subunit G